MDEPKDEIQHRLQRYLDRKVSLADFQEWIVPFYWDLDRVEHGEALALAYKIVGRLAEYSRGSRTENSVRLELENFARSFAARHLVDK